MAERLGVSQPVRSDSECGALRLHGELIAKLAVILVVEILDFTPLTDCTGTSTNGKLQRRLPWFDRLPQRDQHPVTDY